MTLNFLACGFISAGILLGRGADSASRDAPLRALFDREVAQGERQLFASVSGLLRADAAQGPSGVTLDILVDQIELNGARYLTSGGVLIGVGGELATDRILQWRSGRRVALPATLRIPSTYLNRGVADAGRRLAWRGIALVGSVKSDRLVEVTARGSLLSEEAASARAGVRSALRSSVVPWSRRSAAVVSAILIGDRAGLDVDVERRLQDAGTYHVIAISGGNIAIFAGLSVLLLRAVGAGPRTAAVLVILLLTAYAFVVEGGASVGRATLMAAIYFAARIGGHRTLPINVAALTATLLVCVHPLEIVDAGFALTFGATLGILVGAAVFSRRLPTSWWARAPAALLVASLCVEAALLPVNAFVFSRVTSAGLIVNFAAIPMMTIVQIAGMAAVVLTGLWAGGAQWCGWIAHLAVEGLIGSAAVVDVLPWLTRRLAPPSLLVIALYYASLIAFVRGSAVRVAVPAFIGAALWIVAAPVLPAIAHPPLRVTFLDVGQGDAAIVQFPDGRTLSIDAGGLASATFDIGARVVSPALWALGVRRLDYMSITHGDVDHIGGAATVFRDFTPFEVWEGVPVPPHAATRELRALADASGTAWRTLQPDERVSFGDVELIVHHPPRPEWERQDVRNDDSEVLELRYGGVSLVFTGDIGREVERTIASSFAPAPVRILKVPHHGSATSSSQLFLDGLQPDIAVISAGRSNPFGHPVPSVLHRYRLLGAAIYRTDQDGAVTVETDGTTTRVETFNGRRLTLTTTGR